MADMFRYLMKYVGKYQVLTELTTDTNDFIRNDDGSISDDYDELYIPCAFDGKIKHTYRDGVLAYFIDKPRTLKRLMTELSASGIEYEEDDSEEFFYFNDADMKVVAKIVGAKTKGKKIKPFDEKNIPNKIDKKVKSSKPIKIVSEYEIPSKDNMEFYSILAPIKDRSQKIQLTKKCVKDFDAVIKSTKGFDPAKEREKVGIKPKEYIHSIGMWREYLKFIRKAVEESFKK